MQLWHSFPPRITNKTRPSPVGGDTDVSSPRCCCYFILLQIVNFGILTWQLRVCRKSSHFLKIILDQKVEGTKKKTKAKIITLICFHSKRQTADGWMWCCYHSLPPFKGSILLPLKPSKTFKYWSIPIHSTPPLDNFVIFAIYFIYFGFHTHNEQISVNNKIGMATLICTQVKQCSDISLLIKQTH